MKATQRFENAVSKLYRAFHEGTLDAFDCSACAVGNICDNSSRWTIHTLMIPQRKTKEDIKIKLLEKKGEYKVLRTGYSNVELSIIEGVFLDVFLDELNFQLGSKQKQFLGLCAVIEYLCELDNIPNIMDYTKLFEVENDKPKYACAL